MLNTIDKEKIGKLGFGYMRLPTKNNAFDTGQINKMADVFLENGGTYFDTAFIYDGAEEALRESVIKRYPHDRGKIQIATKLGMRLAGNREQMDAQFNTALERLGTDYIDIYLLHGINAMSSKKAEETGAWEFQRELKVKGLVKHTGFSFHGSPEDLEEILGKHPEVEAVQIQLNYLDWSDPETQSQRLYEISRKYDVPIIVMEPLRGGLLTSANSPIAALLRGADKNASMASWAMRYVAQLEGVLVILSGMSSLEQMTDNISTFADIKPLTADEKATIGKAVEILNSVPRINCTSCRYCVNDCPSKIQIPLLIDIYNDYTIHNTLTSLTRLYGIMSRIGGKASDCTACGTCSQICPQNLDIVEIMQKISSVFESPA